MDLSDRRVRLVADMQTAAAQRDRLLAAARDAATQIERFQGAIAMIDELLAADVQAKVASDLADGNPTGSRTPPALAVVGHPPD